MKGISLFIITIFLVSLIPSLTLAQESKIEAKFEVKDDLKLDDPKLKDNIITSNAIQFKSDNSGKEDEVNLEEKTEVKTDTDFKKREIKEEFKIKANEKFMKADSEFKLNAENSVELEAKIKILKECKEDNSQECQDIKRNAIDISKKYLINLIDRITAYLEKLEARYESSEEISVESAQLSLDEIKALKGNLASLKTEIEAATTKEQIIELSNKLKVLLENKIKVNTKLNLERLRLFKIGEIIQRSEHLQIKLNEVLEELKDEGNLSDKVDELITKFNKLIDDAKVNYYSAIEIFAKAKEVRDSNPDEAKKLILEAHNKLTVAHEDLQSAQSILVELYKLVKDKRGNIETKCWEDKPTYKQGEELGFFIWQGTCQETWFIDWSGDLKKLEYEDKEKKALTLESDSSLTLNEQIKLKRVQAEMLKQRLGIKEKLRLRTGNTEVETENEDEISGDLIRDTTQIDTSSSSRGSLESRIKAEIIKANYCSTKEDCTVIGSICPFRCHTAVNKNEASKIKELLNNYQATCQYSCVQLKDVECLKNECVAVTTATPKPSTDERKAYHITGKITTNGKFIDVGPKRFERKDSFKWSDSEITIDAYVSTHSDGLRFRTTGTEVTFDLIIDGKQVKELVFIGDEKKNPDSIPFTLTGKPATTPICNKGEILHEGTCQKKLMAEDSQEATEVQVNTDGSIMMEMQ
ncbi:hypothetical protein J4455_00435 [Candidatus Woesearchaeota archaeon]|nr:hypothetical protein [Candidatus Woesearchaeota archaeon]